MARCCDCLFFDGEEGVYRCRKNGIPVSTHAVALPIHCAYFLRKRDGATEMGFERKYQSPEPSDDQLALHVKLKELEEESSLTRFGLTKGFFAVLSMMVFFLFTLSMLVHNQATSGKEVLSGTHLVVIAVVIAFSVIIYFSFVFRRRSRLKAEISKAKAKIEMVSGDRV